MSNCADGEFVLRCGRMDDLQELTDLSVRVCYFCACISLHLPHPPCIHPSVNINMHASTYHVCNCGPVPESDSVSVPVPVCIFVPLNMIHRSLFFNNGKRAIVK